MNGENLALEARPKVLVVMCFTYLKHPSGSGGDPPFDGGSDWVGQANASRVRHIEELT
jgi:hypothetical protein